VARRVGELWWAWWWCGGVVVWWWRVVVWCVCVVVVGGGGRQRGWDYRCQARQPATLLRCHCRPQLPSAARTPAPHTHTHSPRGVRSASPRQSSAWPPTSSWWTGHLRQRAVHTHTSKHRDVRRHTPSQRCPKHQRHPCTRLQLHLRTAGHAPVS
jgi:hypothetical protein